MPSENQAESFALLLDELSSIAGGSRFLQNELAVLTSSYEKNEAVRQLLSPPLEEKWLEKLGDLVGRKPSPLLRLLLRLMSYEGFAGLLPELSKLLAKEEEGEQGRLLIEIISREELAPELFTTIKAEIRKQSPAEELAFHAVVDPEISEDYEIKLGLQAVPPKKGKPVEILASALVTLSIKKQEEAVVLSDLYELASAWKQNRELQNLFYNPQLNTEDKVDLITQVIGGQISELTLNFWLYIVESGMVIMPDIFLGYAENFFAERGRWVLAKAITAVPMSESTEAKTRQALESDMGLNILVKNEVDHNIIGSLKINLGFKSWDYSVSGRLEQILKSLKQREVEVVA